MYEIGITRRFSSAHRLRNYHGKCENLHGHNYRVEVVVTGDTLVNGMLIDFVSLKQQVDAVIAPLDHACLNDIKPFTELEPSAENIAEYIYRSLAGSLKGTAGLRSVRVWESDDTWALYRTDR